MRLRDTAKIVHSVESFVGEHSCTQMKMVGNKRVLAQCICNVRCIVKPGQEKVVAYWRYYCSEMLTCTLVIKLIIN